MKRSSFLKTLSIGIIAPSVNKNNKRVFSDIKIKDTTKSSYVGDSTKWPIIDEIGQCRIDDVIKFYNETGMLIYSSIEQ